MSHWRTNLILIFIILFGATLIGRLIYIQIINHDYWRALAQGQQKIFEPILGDRGEIFLQDSNLLEDLRPLAINKSEKFCYVSPKEIKNKQETAENLSKILNLTEGELLAKFKNEESLFVPLKHRLTAKEVQNLTELNLPGVYLREEKVREYPQQYLASHLVGFFGGSGIGQYGLEGYYDDILQGKEEFIEGEKGPGGYLIFNSENYQTSKGSNLILTIDYNIQYFSETLLREAQENLNIEGGQILVMDPNSGKIIALADFPNFNPNWYSEVIDFKIFQNGIVQKKFEPGSIFKPITMAAALEEEKITPQTSYVDTGAVKIGIYTISNYNERVWGQSTMTEVLEKSVNTGAVFVERQLGHNLFLEYVEKFGFFEPTGIDLQGEISSQNEELKKGYEINFATASFGQGIEMTPIQLVRAYCAIANGGKLVRPYLVEEIFENSKIIETQPEIQNPSIISPRTASQLTAMLVSVVENGFAKAAKTPGYYIAGKTGTAQIAFSALGINKEGYSEKTWQTFIGFAPAFNPQFLILIKLNNPETKTAEYSAVPIFQALSKYIIDYWQIPPDYE